MLTTVFEAPDNNPASHGSAFIGLPLAQSHGHEPNRYPTRRRGPVTYDLASFKSYIAWDEARVIDWTVRYWEKARKAGLPVSADFGAFYRDFEWMGVQRHIKVLGIFARLCHRDGKDRYLRDMPLVMAHLRQTCGRYNGLGALLRLLDELDRRPPAAGCTF